MQRQKTIFILMLCALSGHVMASTLDLRVDLEAPFVCEVNGDNTIMKLGGGFTTRILEIRKTNDNQTQLDEFEVGCHRTNLGLKCSDYFNIAQVEINAADIKESCPFWRDYCEETVEGELIYRQRNITNLRATKEYELECRFKEI
jgi:hypothetical protein